MSTETLVHHFLYCPVLIGTREEGNGEDYITRSFNFCSHQILFEGLNKNVLAGRACSIFRVKASVWWKTCGCHHVPDQCLHVNIILKWISKEWDVGMDWIDLTQDKDR